MDKSELKDWTRDMLEMEVINMNKKNFRLQSEVNNLRESNARIQEYVELAQMKIGELRLEIERLKREAEGHKKIIDDFYNSENKLMEEIRMLKEKCVNNTKKEDDITHTQTVIRIDEQDIDLESIIYELEEQHSKDCNKIDELTTTVKVLSEILSDLKSRMDECWEI